MRAPTVGLRDYQNHALDALDRAERRGLRRMLMVMATGLGKTIVFVEHIRRRGGRALVLVHREELVNQAVAKIHMLIPDATVGVVKGERDEIDAQIIVASVQSLHPRRLKRLAQDFRTVVIDEAHHAAASSYRRVLEHLGVFEPGGPLLLGVTATPNRGDGRGLDDIFEELAFEFGLVEGVASGWLAPIAAKQIQLAVDLSALRISHGDYAQDHAGEMLMHAHGPDVCAQAWLEHAPGRRGIAFFPTVETAHATAAAAKARGIRAEALDGTTNRDLRRDILARLHSGETELVTNCGVLLEGFDEPAVNGILWARPTRSQPLYAQAIGRGTRTWPGKENLLVLDLVGSTAEHELVTAASLFGVNADELEAAPDVLHVLRERQRRGEPVRVGGRLVALDVEILRNRRAVWVPAGCGYALGADGGIIRLDPIQDGWRVVLSRRDRTEAHLGDAPDLEMAIGIGETYARSGRNAGAILNPDARWRSKPPTKGQLGAMRKLRIPQRPGMTSGQASDEITSAIARIRARTASHSAARAL